MLKLEMIIYLLDEIRFGWRLILIATSLIRDLLCCSDGIWTSCLESIAPKYGKSYNQEMMQSGTLYLLAFSQFLSPLFPSSRVLQYDKGLKIRIIESLFSNFLKENLSSCLQKTTLTLHRVNTDNRYALLTAYVYNGSIFFTDMTYHIKLYPYYTKWCTWVAKSVCKHHSIVGCA